jgi:hypothetical protein
MAKKQLKSEMSRPVLFKPTEEEMRAACLRLVLQSQPKSRLNHGGVHNGKETGKQ